MNRKKIDSKKMRANWLKLFKILKVRSKCAYFYCDLSYVAFFTRLSLTNAIQMTLPAQTVLAVAKFRICKYTNEYKRECARSWNLNSLVSKNRKTKKHHHRQRQTAETEPNILWSDVSWRQNDVNDICKINTLHIAVNEPNVRSIK